MDVVVGARACYLSSALVLLACCHSGAGLSNASGMATSSETAEGPATGDTVTNGEGSESGADPDPRSPTLLPYIWIANSAAGTVSKIDTVGGTEVARYFSGVRGRDDDPSRTAVNLHGDVAVGNRRGGVSKIAARIEDCVDRNGNGSIETSSDASDLLDAGLDECLLWTISLDLPATPYNANGTRVVAWDAGPGSTVSDPEDDRVWLSWHDRTTNTAFFRRLEGATGATLDTVPVEQWHQGKNAPYGVASSKWTRRRSR